MTGDIQAGRVRGYVHELAPTEHLPHCGFLWCCWRPTGRTLSGVDASQLEAERHLDAGVAELAAP